MRLRSVLVSGGVLALSLAPWVAHAQSDDERSAARALGIEGQDALDQKDYAKAADRFGRAVAIFEQAGAATIPPTLLLGLARADANSGKLVNASEAYNRIIRQGAAPNAPQVFLDAMNDAKREIETVTPRIAGVTLNVTGCDAPRVTIDDKPLLAAMLGVKKPIDPGPHVAKAVADGCDPAERTFTSTEGTTTDVALVLVKSKAVVATPQEDQRPSPRPDATPEPQRGSSLKTFAYVGFGLGVAGLGLGGVTGALAIGKHGSLSDECKGGVCPPGKPTDDLSSYHTLGTLSTVGFVVGGVGAAAGGVLMWLSRSPSPTKTTAWVSPVVGPTSIGAVGQF